MRRCFPSFGRAAGWWLVSPLLTLTNAVYAADPAPAVDTRMAASAAIRPAGEAGDAHRAARSPKLPAPTPVLVLHARDGRSWRLTLDDLRRLPVRRLRTALPASLGMAGASEWEGVPLSALARLGGGASRSLALSALNAYAVTVPAQDLTRYDPVLAYRRDGQDIAVRDKGPLILIYPFDRFPAALNTQAYINRTIWQVHEITLE